MARLNEPLGRSVPAGDHDYERLGAGYSLIRREDPRIAALVRAALGDARSVVNVGAGAGSYEPEDLDVTAVEPAAAMRAQRPANRAVAIDAVAEDLPFDDASFDAAMATISIHQWRDLERGLRELRRVARGPVVLLTFDPVRLLDFWLSDYAPAMMSHESGRMPTVTRVAAALGGRLDVRVVPIPSDCVDGFAEAFYCRPEALLDERVRAGQSAWSFVSDDEVARSIDSLARALGDGSWDARHGALRELPHYDGSLRLLVAEPR